MGVRRRGAAAVLAVAITATAAAPGAALAPASAGPGGARACPLVPGVAALPSAEDVLGRSLDATPLGPAEADRLLVALDAASPRIVTGVAGRSVRGRPLRYALVGDPRALTPARAAAISRRLRAVRRGDGPRAAARAAAGPAVVWVGAGVHGNEPSGTTAALGLLRHLGTDDSCATRRSLAGTMTVVVPDQNPDGRAAGTRTNAADVDLNRDWFAASQPETTARLRLLRRLPPTLALDLHEQTGADFFAPPYAAPVVAGLPRATRRLADVVVSGAIDRELARDGVRPRHRGYDLLYPGYADSATSLLFGAGGMTLEQGSDPPLAEKARRLEHALRAALDAVGSDPGRAVRAWAAGFAAAERAGRAGRGAAGDVVHGWFLRTDRRDGDAGAVALRLRRDGLRVVRTRRRVSVRIDPLGPAGPARRALPAGTLVVPAAQPLSRWADAILGRDAAEAGPASVGTDSWSVPRAAGIDAGALREPLPASAIGTFEPPARLRVPDGTRVRLDGGGVVEDRLALRALAAGRPLARRRDGSLRTTADAAWLTSAAAAGATVRPAGPGRAGESVLRLPRVLAVADPSPLLVGPPALLPAGDRASGWIADALGAAGVAPRTLPGAEVERGIPPGTTHLLLGPGPFPGGAPSGAAGEAVAAFVRGGGTVLALGAGGAGAARALGVSSVGTQRSGSTAAVAVRAVPGADPVGRLLGGPTSVLVAGEPLLTAPPGATVPLRAAAGRALAPSGAAGAGAGLGGRPLLVAEALGVGRVLTLGFSPAFRRQSGGGEHVLLALLLAGG